MRRRVLALITRLGCALPAAAWRPGLLPSSRVISLIRSPRTAYWCWYPARAAC